MVIQEQGEQTKLPAKRSKVVCKESYPFPILITIENWIYAQTHKTLKTFITIYQDYISFGDYQHKYITSPTSVYSPIPVINMNKPSAKTRNAFRRH